MACWQPISYISWQWGAMKTALLSTGVRTVSVVHLAPVLRLLASIATVLSPSFPFGIRM